MHFKAFLILSFLGSCLASPLLTIPIDKRDLTTIENALTSISKSVSILDNSIRSLSIHPNATSLVATNSQTVLRTITTATMQVEGSQAISLTDAINLQRSGLQLANMVMATIKDLVSQRVQIERAGGAAITLQSLQAQQNASAILGEAIEARVPTLAVQQAKMQAGMISMAFDMGIIAFSQKTTGTGKSQISCARA
jgi:Hydrophobic surface binding protein A